MVIASLLRPSFVHVWNLCDGEKSVAAIRQLLAKRLKKTVTEDLVRLALDQLNKENLLEKNQGAATGLAGGLSRREALRRAGSGLASVIALPLITSLAAPKVVTALSGSTCPPFNSGAGSTGDTCDCAPGTTQGVNCGVGGDFGGGACQNTRICTAGTVIRPGTNTVIGLCG